jgi:zinc finger protein
MDKDYINTGRQLCPVCGKHKLRLIETPYDIPYFGRSQIFSMICRHCKYRKIDVVTSHFNSPARYSVRINSIKDMSIRVIKSSHAKFSVPGIINWESSSDGFISNIEGILLKLQNAIQMSKPNTPHEKEMAEKYINVLQKVMEGKESIELILEDSTGTSAIISEKATKNDL